VKVLRVLPSVDPEFGGPPEADIRSCVATQRAGIETVAVIGVERSTADRSRANLEVLRSNGISVHVLRTEFGSFGQRNAILRGLHRKIKSLGDVFDVIHLHSPWAVSSIMTVARSSRAPLVMTPHEGFTHFDIGRSRLGHLKRLLLHRYGRSLAAVVYSSSLEAMNTAVRGPLAFVVPHAVVDDTDANGAVYTHGEIRHTFGYLGRLHPKKNIELCIRATAALSTVRLIIAGDGPPEYLADLKRLAEATGAAPRVDFLGFIQQREKASFFDAIDGLLLVSEFECFGVAAAEALAAGVPVIVSGTTGIADVVGRHGCGIVAERTVQSVTDTMARLLSEERKPMIARASYAANVEYSYRAHAEKLAAAYSGCVPGL
jgi:glycosyltransferase involved in cell wall biosynthesis